jgi:hypothetical protein
MAMAVMVVDDVVVAVAGVVVANYNVCRVFVIISYRIITIICYHLE